MDLGELQRRVDAVESAAAASAAAQRRLAHELDLLAEHLIGESGPEFQEYKRRIQALISRVAPDRRDITLYTQVYCHISRR